MKDFLGLPALERFSEATLLVLRAFVGAFLVWGTWDNISSAEQMAEFVAFLRHFRFPAPEIMAPLSVWAQFLCGLALVAGLFTRWAALIMVFNFTVAVVMVHLNDDFRAQFPALILIAVNLHFAAAGGGRFALDRLLK